jgi:GNAT superfamily N-acetyltransferase
MPRHPRSDPSSPVPVPPAGESFAFHPLTAERWPDLVELFGPHGACAGCWCMFWRLPRREWEAARGSGTKRRLAAIVRKGRPTGVIAYDAGEPVGWCAVAPREDYPALTGSRLLAPVDDRPVWSITCFFVKRDYRRRGLTGGLIAAAADYAHSQGATVVEAYPKDTKKKSADAFLWNGVATAFSRAGFAEVVRRSPTRPIMRKHW